MDTLIIFSLRRKNPIILKLSIIICKGQTFLSKGGILHEDEAVN